jgi:hypothetical protein
MNYTITAAGQFNVGDIFVEPGFHEYSAVDRFQGTAMSLNFTVKF